MPLSDGAGEVSAIGEGVTLVKVGDRVIGTFHPRWFGGPLSADYLTDRLGANLDGMLAEYAVLSEEALVPVPSHLSFEEAATLPRRRSDRLGRTGGPSSGDRRRHRLDAGFGRCLGFCAAICPGLGRVIATTSTAEKAERLKVLGASEVINYTETPDWDVKARELTDGRGVDCVVEIGRPGTIAKSLKALAVGGHLSLIGASLSPSGAMLDPLLLTGWGITVGAINVGSRADFEAMNRTIAQHRLRPVIDRTFPFAEANAASPFRRPQPFRQGRDHTRMSGSVSPTRRTALAGHIQHLLACHGSSVAGRDYCSRGSVCQRPGGARQGPGFATNLWTSPARTCSTVTFWLTRARYDATCQARRCRNTRLPARLSPGASLERSREGLP
jgi:NADPH:quinone reductase-like Zn-dependent oxidoreductase